MTGRTPAQGVLRPSLRAKRSNPEPQERLDCFVADAPRNDGTGYRRKEFLDRHCERSEAIQSRKKGWIASSLTLPCTNASRLSQAMTGRTPAQGVLRPSLR